MGSVLVTGGAGYIGSHAVKALGRAGHDVVVLDNLVAGHAGAVAGVPRVNSDIADTETVRDTIRRYSVSAVMHFAALASVGESVSHPGQYYRVNVAGTLSLLDASVALTRHLSLYGQGFYYRSVTQDAAVASTLPSGVLERRGVGVGLTWRIPLFATGYRS